jgi:hypothetical protein
VADCSVTKFEISEGLEEALLVDITIKPTYSASAPQWYVSGGSEAVADLVATGQGLAGAGTYEYQGTQNGQNYWRYVDSNGVVWSLLFNFVTWIIHNPSGDTVYVGPALETGPEGNYVHGEDTLVVAEEA